MLMTVAWGIRLDTGSSLVMAGIVFPPDFVRKVEILNKEECGFKTMNNGIWQELQQVPLLTHTLHDVIFFHCESISMNVALQVIIISLTFHRAVFVNLKCFNVSLL